MILAVLVFVTSATGSAWMLDRGTPPEKLENSAQIPDAMRQAGDLAQALAQVGFDATKVDPKLLRLPDQEFDQDVQARAQGVPSFCVPIDAIYDQVACYTTLYSQVILEPSPGNEAKGRHTGFVIVAWKNGKVEKIGVESIRLMPRPGHDNQFLYVWPGLSVYSTDLPLLTANDTLEAAKPNS
jgi:hypothetical protein